MAKKQRQAGCPCGSGSSRSDCCGRFLDGCAHASTAEALMRSRYTAFVEQNADYLRATWHPEHRPAEVRFDPDLRWLGLSITNCVQGGVEDERGEVTFIARAKPGGHPAYRHHERSTFVRSQGLWVYLYGEIINP